jgi:hypothetical protein
MKKIFSILAAIAFTSFANAQVIYEAGAEGNDTELGIALGEEIEDITAIPVNIVLTDPQQNINSFQMYLQLPDGATWNYDDDEGDYIYEKNSKRCYGSHNVSCEMSGSSKRVGQFYTSISSSKQQMFKLTEGTLVTFYFDGSKLADGNYEIKVIDALASNGPDKFLSQDSTCAFSIANGAVTGINGVSADAEGATYYNASGVQQNGLQPGVNIVKYANGTTQKVYVK